MKSYIVLKISGNNINRFINKVIKNNINIYELNKISRKCISITIDHSDYEKINKLKGIYDIEILRYKGLKKAIDIGKKNIIIYICLIISILNIYILSNFIFSIKIYHTNAELKKELISELEKYDIKIGKYKKSFKQIEKIKKEILEKYKEKIEWLEITRVGTLYEIRLEERIINKSKKNLTPQNIIAKKQGIIKNIYATNGVILKNEDEYVSPGEVIISGEIYLNEKLKETIPATGVVYAETWYTVKLNFPLYYRNETKTGRKKTVLNINFLNKDYNLFNIKKFKNYNKKSKILYKNSLLPISISIQEQKEINLIENIYDVKTAEIKALEYATDKISSKLNDKEYIISKKVLKNEQKDSTIYMEIFFKIYEDITSIKEIIPPEEESL